MYFERYAGQRIFVVKREDYVYLVPFIEDEQTVFLKTIIPSRKAENSATDGSVNRRNWRQTGSLDTTTRREGSSELGSVNRGATPTTTVPTIVPATRQNSVSRANASQLDRSVKWKRLKDLRGKLKMPERRISV